MNGQKKNIGRKDPGAANVKYVTNGHLLEKAYRGDAAYDIRASISSDVIIESGERKLIGTGIRLQPPADVEGQIRPRSGLAAKHGLSVLNSPGTIDPGYRGEVKVILINLGKEAYIVKDGDRIAQLVFSRLHDIEVIKEQSLEAEPSEVTEEGPETNRERKEKGFGSSGTK